jgi:hypothetical protein
MNNYSVKDVDIRKASEMQNKMKENMEQVKEALQKPIPTTEQKVSQSENTLKKAIEQKTKKVFKSIDDFRSNGKLADNDKALWKEYHENKKMEYTNYNTPTSSISPKVIAPDYAKYLLLECIDKQREIRPSNVKKITKDITSNKWAVSNASIGFDTNGNVIDGQHRLLACVNADKPISSLMVWNLAPETYKNIDRGASRNVKDDMEVEVGLSETLDLKGKANSNVRVTKVIGWLKAILSCKSKSAGKSSIGQGFTISTQEQTELIESEILNDEAYLDAVKWYEQFTFEQQRLHPELKKTKSGRPCQFARYQGVAAALVHYRVLQPELAYDFTSKLYGGCEIVAQDDGNLSTVALDKDNPIMRLRNKIISHQGSGSEVQDGLYSLTKNAIHKHYKGEKVKSFNQFKNETIHYSDWKIPNGQKADAIIAEANRQEFITDSIVREGDVDFKDTLKNN